MSLYSRQGLLSTRYHAAGNARMIADDNTPFLQIADKWSRSSSASKKEINLLSSDTHRTDLSGCNLLFHNAKKKTQCI